MSLNTDRNFAEQSTHFCSDTAVADVNTYVGSGLFQWKLYKPAKLKKRKAMTLT